MDGVAYSEADTVVGVWMTNQVTERRHLIGLIRKRIVCACGCRGWCTWHPLLCFLKWSIAAMAAGVFPQTRHDGKPFAASEETRQELGGKPLRSKAAVVCFKGDWSEFCDRFGFPAHASSVRPCFCCSATGGEDSYSPTG
eukprot:4166027-Alexandrium_andersonii.AAC.1